MPSAHVSGPAAYTVCGLAAIDERLALLAKIAVGVPPPSHNTSEDVEWYITFTCSDGSGQFKSFMNLLTDNAMLVN
jgi:hypothetical protein